MPRDRRTLHLIMPHKPVERPGRGPARFVNVWTAPELGRVLLRYLRDVYEVEPREVLRRRSIWLDSGGTLCKASPVVAIPMDGWAVRLRLYEAPGFADAWERRLARPHKVYPCGTEAVRVSCGGGVPYTVIVSPEQGQRIAQELRKLAQAGLDELALREAELDARAAQPGSHVIRPHRQRLVVGEA